MWQSWAEQAGRQAGRQEGGWVMEQAGRWAGGRWMGSVMGKVLVHRTVHVCRRRFVLDLPDLLALPPSRF